MLKPKRFKILPAITILLISLSGAAFAAQADDSEAPPSLNIAIPSSCTENTTTDNDSKLCQNGSYITCDAARENTKSKDGQKVCQSGKWVATPTNPTPPDDDDEAPPSLTIKTDNPEPPDTPDNPDTPSGGTLKITKADAYPKGFNPTVSESKISYEVNQDAVIEVKITNSNDLNVAKLVENKKISAGDYFVNWKGTSNNEQNGTILAPGTYKYKILAKDPNTSEIKDTAEGEISLIYSAPQTEDKGDVEPPKEIDKQEAKATQTLNNSTSGKTAKTGPDILIYSIFPIAGYFISRRRHQSRSEPESEQSERSENH